MKGTVLNEKQTHLEQALQIWGAVRGRHCWFSPGTQDSPTSEP